MYCTIILPLFLQYVMDIENVICHWPIMLQSTLVTPLISSALGISLERRMLNKILYEIDSKGMRR
jgi:hypothetical protein